MPRKKLPDAATDPLYHGGKRPSRVEADDIAEDIATARKIAEAKEPQHEQACPDFTAWLQRKKPK